MRTLSVLVVLALATACDRHPASEHVHAVETTHAHRPSPHDQRAIMQRVEAMAHHEAGDYAAFTRQMETIVEGDHEAVDVYNLACGYALTGQHDKALERIAWLVERGATYNLATDTDFDSLRGKPEFQALLTRAKSYDMAEQYIEPARELAMKHYREGDHETFALIMEKIAPWSDHPIDTYNLACAFALMGRHDDAIAALERLAEWGVDYGAADDPDFASLYDDPRFHAVLARFASL